jgi:hypothetical protein
MSKGYFQSGIIDKNANLPAGPLTLNQRQMRSSVEVLEDKIILSMSSFSKGKELKFERFWKALDKKGFECIHVSKPKEAYEEFLLNKTSIRFAEKGNFQPNFELKFPHSKENFYSINNKLIVILNGQELITSEIEMQIAFKLKLGSEKDFEDARHLYKVFKEHLNMNKLKSHISELGVEKEAEEALWKSF